MESKIQDIIRLSTFGSSHVIILASATYQDNVLILGKFSGVLTLNDSNVLRNNNNNYSFFLASYSPFSNGLQLNWSKKIAETPDNSLDVSGSILIVGSDTYVSFEFSNCVSLANNKVVKINGKGDIILALDEDLKLIYYVTITGYTNSNILLEGIINVGGSGNNNSNRNNNDNRLIGRSNSNVDIPTTNSNLLIGLNFNKNNKVDINNTLFSTDKAADFLIIQLNTRGMITNSKKLDLGTASLTVMILIPKNKSSLLLAGNYQNSMAVDGFVLTEDNSYLNSWFGTFDVSTFMFTSLDTFISLNEEFKQCSSSMNPSTPSAPSISNMTNVPINGNTRNGITNSNTTMMTRNRVTTMIKNNTNNTSATTATSAIATWNENSNKPHFLITHGTVDERQNYYFTGRINGKYKFGSTLVETTGDTIFLLKLDRFGALQFITTIDYDFRPGNNKTSIYPHLSIENSYNNTGTGVFLTSGFHFSIKLNDSNGNSVNIDAEGSYPHFVAKYNKKDGSLIHCHTYSTTETYKRRKIALGEHLYMFGNVDLGNKMTSYIAKLIR